MKLEVTQTTKETIRDMINSKTIIQEWESWNRGRRNKGAKSESFDELVRHCLTPSRYIVDIISGEIELVTKPEKKYRIIIAENAYDNEGVLWDYIYAEKVNSDVLIDYADYKYEIPTYTQEELTQFPKHLRLIAEEVK